MHYAWHIAIPLGSVGFVSMRMDIYLLTAAFCNLIYSGLRPKSSFDFHQPHIEFP